MTPADNQHPIEALPSDGADKALGKRIGTRRADPNSDDPDALSAEDLIEAGRELGVPVPDEEPPRPRPIDELER